MREKMKIISGEAGYIKRKGVNPGACYDRSLEPKIFSVRGRPSRPHANRNHFRLRPPRQHGQVGCCYFYPAATRKV